MTDTPKESVTFNGVPVEWTKKLDEQRTLVRLKHPSQMTEAELRVLAYLLAETAKGAK